MSEMSTHRERSMRERPDFPWLDAARPDTVEGYLRQAGWLQPEELFRGCDRAGEGNMNLTLRVRTDRRRFILKQARPWVEKYDDIPAPWDRALFEQRFYRRIQEIRGVASRMPRLVGCDPEARVTLLEDIPAARDRSDLYAAVATRAAGGVPEPTLDASELDELAAFLRHLHSATRGTPDPELANREMRALNHQHIFVVPLDPSNGLKLDAHEPHLAAARRALCEDADYRIHVSALGERYRADGPCLVHGDYFPGSWLQCAAGLRIIDPEFAYFGDPEVDLGCAAAHLALAGQPPASASRLLGAYAKYEPAPAIDRPLLARYAAVEVMRRLIGVAQLPIPPTRGFRSRLLERSRRAMLQGELDVLYE